MLRSLILSIILAGFGHAGIDLRLPTGNQSLFSGPPEKFYMYVDRTFEGETSQPWQAGSFGMVRNAMRLDDQVILTKFHEGIDISPLARDQAGNPLDIISTIADGRVVYISLISGRSNYGKYVVIEHSWEGSLVYSLYAHLADITCKTGDLVKAGDSLGRMGYTGSGLNRTRAHLHLELGMMLTRHYEDWCKHSAIANNYHGLFNGMNLIGTDPAGFFIQHKANPELKFSEYITSSPVYFKVTVPSSGIPDFVARYPWICRGNPEGAKSWEISFSATGQPVAFSPSQRQVDAPLVTAIRPSKIPQRYLTRNLISGQENQATLTSGGKQLITLLTDAFPITDEQVTESKSAAPKS